MRRSLAVVLALGVPASLLVPSVAHAANYTFCMFYHVASEDSGNGEDYYTSTNFWRARGAKVRVREVVWPFNTTWEGYAAESNGCFNFSSTKSQFYVDLYAETRLGPTGNVTLQAVSNASQTTPGYWTISSSPNLTAGTHYFYGPASDISNILAISNFTYYWFDVHGGGRITTATEKTRIINESCPGLSYNSCNWPSGPDGISPGRVYIHPDSDHKKFLIAHEMGHQIYALHRGDGSFGNFNCAVNSGGSACTYLSGNAHALHSKEYQSCTLSEGFAHFVAADVFNNHSEQNGYFHYYKSNYPTSVDVEAGPVGGATRFMENTCAGTFAGYGVELDWLRAFWDYHTDAGTKPSHRQILEQLAWTHDQEWFGNDLAYFVYWYSAIADGLGDRWSSVSATNGIDHIP